MYFLLGKVTCKLVDMHYLLLMLSLPFEQKQLDASHGDTQNHKKVIRKYATKIWDFDEHKAQKNNFLTNSFSPSV
jgi:hypothetical protein